MVTIKGSREKMIEESAWFGLTTRQKIIKEPILETSQSQAKRVVFDLGNGIKLEMVSIPKGSFQMGSENGNSDEKPAHQVEIKKAFWMGKYPVTQAQYQQIMGNNPSRFKGEKRPVETVSWLEAVEFCKKLSQKLEMEFRLPIEAEWEYACRAKTTTPFHFGETITTDLVNYNDNYPYGNTPKGDYRKQTVEVDYFKHANNFGLYQMHGNVWEWCEDSWKEHFNTPRTQAAHKNHIFNINKLLRGGSWFNHAEGCRSSCRGFNSAVRGSNFGFRLALFLFP